MTYTHTHTHTHESRIHNNDTKHSYIPKRRELTSSFTCFSNVKRTLFVWRKGNWQKNDEWFGTAYVVKHDMRMRHKVTTLRGEKHQSIFLLVRRILSHICHVPIPKRKSGLNWAMLNYLEKVCFYMIAKKRWTLRFLNVAFCE